MSLAYRFLLAILILLLCGGRLAFSPAIAGQASADEAALGQEKSGQPQIEQQPPEQQSTLEEEEQQAEEQKAYERFLAILKRRPAAGTALDRVYSYHQDRETLDDFCATLRSDAAGSADGSTSLILGMIELRQGHEEAAIAALESAEKLRPDDSISSWTLGQALVLAGRTQEAVSAFERALARKPARAVKIAHIDPYRATTHNKGIFNGIDAVILATGNDFKATEAAGHTYAAKDGQYRSLSYCEINDGIFRFWLDVPLAIGTVGGLTSLHPLAKKTLDILGNPSAEKLMRIIASVGLAQNFAALRSLVTTGIQQGHMKMHMMNILNHLQASELECKEAMLYFNDKTVSFSAVREFLDRYRVENL